MEQMPKPLPAGCRVQDEESLEGRFLPQPAAQVIQLCGASPNLLIEQAKHQGYRSRACPIRNNHQYSLVGRVKSGSYE